MHQNIRTKKRAVSSNSRINNGINSSKLLINKKKKSVPYYNNNKKYHTKKNILQKGGSRNKENFEFVSLDNFDYNNVTISNKLKVDWGHLPSPPDLDCTIL